MREPAVTPVLVLKMSISNARRRRPARTCPVSSAHSGSAAVMLPQFTLQSIAALSAASCANVLTMRRRLPSASSSGEEHLVAGRHDPPQPGDLLVAGARAFQRQAHQVAQQFLAQRPARAAPSVPRSPARSRCRRARGARETRSRCYAPVPAFSGRAGKTALPPWRVSGVLTATFMRSSVSRGASYTFAPEGKLHFGASPGGRRTKRTFSSPARH